MSDTSKLLYSLPTDGIEFARGYVIVTDLFKTARGHFARITDRHQVAYVSRGHDGHYDHLDSDACPIHPDADTASRREIAVAEAIAHTSSRAIEPTWQAPA